MGIPRQRYLLCLVLRFSSPYTAPMDNVRISSGLCSASHVFHHMFTSDAWEKLSNRSHSWSDLVFKHWKQLNLQKQEGASETLPQRVNPTVCWQILKNKVVNLCGLKDFCGCPSSLCGITHGSGSLNSNIQSMSSAKSLRSLLIVCLSLQGPSKVHQGCT